MFILSPDAAKALKLKINSHSFKRFEKVGLSLPRICADYVPTAIDEFNASDFEGTYIHIFIFFKKLFFVTINNSISLMSLVDWIFRAKIFFDFLFFPGIEIEGPIGVNITALELAGVNLTELAEKLRNDTEVDEILTRTYGTR